MAEPPGGGLDADQAAQRPITVVIGRCAASTRSWAVLAQIGRRRASRAAQ